MNNPLLHVVLYEPEIPPNTGNIIRLCANTGANLHLIRPFGFEWDNSKLKRAGLDYHDLTHVSLYDNYADFLRAHNNQESSRTATPPRLFACTTKGQTGFHEATFQAGDTFVFGPETRGLPDPVLAEFPAGQKLRIPMQPQSRSLNVANSVAVILYEAWRQLDFVGGV